jgi:hypothetical protein
MGSFRKSPGWFRALNLAWEKSRFLGTRIRLDKDELIRSARKVTGLQDLGRDFNDDPLERLLQAANNEANLHPIGRFITRERFVIFVIVRVSGE